VNYKKKSPLLILVALLMNAALLTGQDTVQVFVALWDSPPEKDLYWGMRYGMKTWLSQDEHWKLVDASAPGGKVQEQLLFYNEDLNLYLDAKAYHADSIKTTITDFIQVAYERDSTELVMYVGHDGLMDFDIDLTPQKNACDVMVFSCVSEDYFSPYLDMILSTYTDIAPEAYGVMAAIEAWARKETETSIRKKTAVAYAKYQKISVGSAEYTFIQ
jgi:hypothetical protein